MASLEPCYFDLFVYTQFGELLQYAVLSEDDWHAIYNKVISSEVAPPVQFVDSLFVKGLDKPSLAECVSHLLEQHGNTLTQSLWESRESLDAEKIARDLKEKNDPDFSLSYIRWIQSKFPDTSISLCDLLLDYSENRIDILFTKLISLKKLNRKEECIKVISSIPFEEIITPGLEIIADIAAEWKLWHLFIEAATRIVAVSPSPELHARLAVACAQAYDDNGAIHHAEAALQANTELDPRHTRNALYVLIETLQLMGKANEACHAFKKHAMQRSDFETCLLGADVFLKSRLPDREERAHDLIIKGIRGLEHVDDEIFLAIYIPTLELVNSGKIKLNDHEEVANGHFIKLDGILKWFYVGKSENAMGAIAITKSSENYSAVIGRRLNESIDWPADRFSGAANGRRIVHILNPGAFLSHRAHEAIEAAAISGDKPIWSVKMLTDDGNLDLENIRKISADFNKNSDELLDMYVNGSVPFAFLCKSEGSPTQAIGRIRTSEKGVIKCNNGTGEQIEEQLRTARLALDGATCYLDGVSALVLLDAGLLETVCTSIPNIGVCSSVIRLFRREAKNLESSFSSVGRASFVEHGIIFQAKDEQSENNARMSLLDAADFLDGIRKKKIEKQFVSLQGRMEWINKLPNYTIDPICSAQDEDALLLTEDAVLSEALKAFGAGNQPNSFSSLSLVRVLAERGKLDWESYFRFLGRLSQNRFFLLPISAEEIMRAIMPPIGGNIVIVRPSNLELLNLGYTLSKDNGVDDRLIIIILAQFFSQVVKDESISTELADEIFSLALIRGLKGKERAKLRHPLLALCRHLVNSGIYSGLESDKKLKLLCTQVNRHSGEFDPLIEASPTIQRFTKPF